MSKISKASQFLVEAKKLIDSPEKWTQDSFAKDQTGAEVSYASSQATCFCSLGALRRVELNEFCDDSGELRERSKRFLNRAIEETTSYSLYGIAPFNDEASHEEVMAVWDEAIKLAKSKEV